MTGRSVASLSIQLITLIRWIANYPVDSAIQRSNNRGREITLTLHVNLNSALHNRPQILPTVTMAAYLSPGAQLFTRFLTRSKSALYNGAVLLTSVPRVATVEQRYCSLSRKFCDTIREIYSESLYIPNWLGQ